MDNRVIRKEYVTLRGEGKNWSRILDENTASEHKNLHSSSILGAEYYLVSRTISGLST